jgi:hypothetical protein
MLRVVGVGGIGEVDEDALTGSYVKEVFSCNGMWLDESVLASAIARVTPPTGVVVAGEWLEERTVATLMRLKVRRGAPLPTESHRNWLASIDLSGLEGLPRGWTLQDCPFLESVLLPRNLVKLPKSVFGGCFALVGVNLHECKVLRKIGQFAFEDCVRFRRVELPACLGFVDLVGSGIEELDLRGTIAEEVQVAMCPTLVRLVLRSGYGRGNWDLCPCLRRVTFGRLSYDIGDDAPVSTMDEVRFLAPFYQAAAFPPGFGVCLSRAVVLAELGALAGQQGCPLLAP